MRTKTRLLLVSVAEQAGLSLTWLKTPEDRFSHDMAQFILFSVVFFFFFCRHGDENYGEKTGFVEMWQEDQKTKKNFL